MPTAGIVAEYNPFHTGHAYQIAQTRQVLGQDAAVVAVMSGNWIQQADCAIADKWTRAKLALMGGVDLVLELPTVWAMSSAESFARGAVSILNDTGVVDVLSFGSECGQTQPLEEAADCLDCEEYRIGLSRFLDQGMSFAAARQAAVEELLGRKSELSRPNNNLGIEYIRALKAMGSSIRPMTVLRQGAAHNSVRSVAVRSGSADADMSQFVSATQIRMDLLEGRWDHAEPYLVPGGRQLLEGRLVGLPELRWVERAVLTRLRTMTAADWAQLPDAGEAEGLPRRLEQAGRQCTCVEEFFQLAKTKRYTHARLRRLVLWAFLGLRMADVPTRPPYLRVLGFNARGRDVLRQMRNQAALPILTKPAHARELDSTGCRLFELEARCTDLYHLCFEAISVSGKEWITGPVILP